MQLLLTAGKWQQFFVDTTKLEPNTVCTWRGEWGTSSLKCRGWRLSEERSRRRIHLSKGFRRHEEHHGRLCAMSAEDADVAATQDIKVEDRSDAGLCLGGIQLLQEANGSVAAAERGEAGGGGGAETGGRRRRKIGGEEEGGGAERSHGSKRGGEEGGKEGGIEFLYENGLGERGLAEEREGEEALSSSIGIEKDGDNGVSVWSGEEQGSERHMALAATTAAAMVAAVVPSATCIATSDAIQPDVDKWQAAEKATSPIKPPSFAYRNSFLELARLPWRLQQQLESVVENEVVRRAAATLLLLLLARVGHFIPLPGFHLSPATGTFFPTTINSSDVMLQEMQQGQLTLFSLGLYPMITSISLIQILCALKWFPALSELEQQGSQGRAVIMRIVFRISIGFSVIFSIFTLCANQCFQQQLALRGSRYFAVCVFLLSLGATLLDLISTAITKAGLGEGTSLLICLSILSDLAQSLPHLSLITSSQSLLSLLKPLLVTAGATWLSAFVLTIQRTVRLSYFDFDVGRSALKGLPEVEPSIPFLAVPHGMMPIFSTSILFASISIFLAPFPWLRSLFSLPQELAALVKSIWTFLLIAALNIFEMNDITKELAESMMLTGARIPNKRPGLETTNELRRARDSARFFGGIALASLAVASVYLDTAPNSWLGKMDVNITSLLIIVGAVTSLRASFEAYSQAPFLEKVAFRFQLL